MNVFELLIFAVHCTAGFLCGKILAGLLGLWGWLLGVPIGFAASFCIFYYGIKLLDKRKSK